MATAQTLISSKGPLPLTAKFSAKGDGDVVFFVSGSAWTRRTGGKEVGINVILEGERIGTLSVFTNEASSHKALIPVIIPHKLGFGDNTLELTAINGDTVTDVNDHFNVTLIY